jgi:transglutaminase-like putative cysteine protease
MFAVEHNMHYRFDRPVSLTPHLIRLRPAPHCRVPVRAYSLEVEPAEHSIEWLHDSFDNHLARLSFGGPVAGFSVDIDLKLEMPGFDPYAPAIETSSICYPFEYDPALQGSLAPYLRIAESGPLLRDWLRRTDCRRRLIRHFLADLGMRLRNEIDYRMRMQSGVQDCERTLLLGNGSCRDSAWLLVQILRHLGFAARFVSGYLIQPAEEISVAGDSVELHAWAEVYIPGAGWLGMDSTSGLFAGAGHIPLACAPEPFAAAPLSGKIGRCAVMLEFHTAVSRIN